MSKFPPGRSSSAKGVSIGKDAELNQKKRKDVESESSEETSDQQQTISHHNNSNNQKNRGNQRNKQRTAPRNDDENPASNEGNSFSLLPTSSSSGRSYTVSIALPGSIISNAQSPELRTYLAGQIARAAAIFNIDEIIVFSENTTANISSQSIEGEFRGANRHSDPDIFLARLLQYLETPQYLRKQLFPVHNDLQYAGLLNPLDSPHHLRANQDSLYREGIVINRPVKAQDRAAAYVNAGIKSEIKIDRNVQAGVRVTVKLDKPVGSSAQLKGLTGKAVAPSEPKELYGLYWGYNVRLASSITKVWTECPYKSGYDCSIGTSDKGKSIDSKDKTLFQTAENSNPDPSKLPFFNHLVIVFGGLYGLEQSIESDNDCQATDPSQLFDYYINAVHSQGSRTIRTEEAILITLSLLQPYIIQNKPSP
jgi:predicted SPOUT superfamily RNA methylase MTH1